MKELLDQFSNLLEKIKKIQVVLDFPKMIIEKRF